MSFIPGKGSQYIVKIGAFQTQLRRPVISRFFQDYTRSDIVVAHATNLFLSASQRDYGA